jgi:hypothetical protein
LSDRKQGLVILAALCWALGLAVHAMAGTAPAPYTSTQVNQSTVNALGGVGRTETYRVAVDSSAGLDLLADAQIPASLRAELESPTVTTLIRTIAVRRVVAHAALGTEVACLRLGPNKNDGTDPSGAPALTCGVVDSTAPVGGVSLWQDAQSTSYTQRPILSCTSYATCHVPIWAIGSAAVAHYVVLEVSVSW